MAAARAAKLLRVHVSEADRWAGEPLHEAIVAKCREMGVAGATVLRGVEGYGDAAELHRGGLLGRDRPIEVVVVDSAEKVAALAAAVEPMLDTGVMAVSDVQVVRVQKPS